MTVVVWGLNAGSEEGGIRCMHSSSNNVCVWNCMRVWLFVLSLCACKLVVLKRMELMCLWVPQDPADAPPAPGERVELRQREWPLSCHQPHPRSLPGRAAWNATCGTQEAPQIQVRASFLVGTSDHILTGAVTSIVEQSSFWGVTVKLRKIKTLEIWSAGPQAFYQSVIWAMWICSPLFLPKFFNSSFVLFSRYTESLQGNPPFIFSYQNFVWILCFPCVLHTPSSTVHCRQFAMS